VYLWQLEQMFTLVPKSQEIFPRVCPYLSFDSSCTFLKRLADCTDGTVASRVNRNLS
jgi:hypothetical protein